MSHFLSQNVLSILEFRTKTESVDFLLTFNGTQYDMPIMIAVNNSKE